MKKSLFALLTAACFAGAASAVTDSWTSGTISGTQSSSFSIGMVLNIADVDAFVSSTVSTLIAVSKYADPSTGGPSFLAYTDGKIGGKGNDGKPISGDGGGNGSYQSYDNTDTEYDIAKFLKTNKVEGEYSVALTVEMFTDSSNQLCSTYTLYINGHEAFSSTHKNIGSAVYSYDSIVTYEGASDVYYMSGVASDKDIASLPEPTALALLALGAAGLALRRKMA